jgi:transcriptional regulator GlxA family with amidase domain
MNDSASTKDIAILGFPDAQLLDIAGPAQVFASASELVEDRETPAYRVTVVSRAGGEIVTSAGLGLSTVSFDDAAGRSFDTVIASGGHGVHLAAEDTATVEWLRAQAAVSRRCCSVCTGAFLLAAAGVLVGKRAATHWAYCDELAAQYPDIRVEGNPIFVEDGGVWTSAGVTAGIDLSLALVEADLGRRLALQAAQRLVVFMKRPGGQAQFSSILAAQLSDNGDFADLHAWMADNLSADLRVEHLAERAGMSPRTFARVYRDRTGMTPAKVVTALRVEAARRLLEETALPVGQVALRCGFGEEERMRRAFLHRLGVAPGRYRQRFSIEAAE